LSRSSRYPPKGASQQYGLGFNGAGVASNSRDWI
jgi:hypothetical protein